MEARLVFRIVPAPPVGEVQIVVLHLILWQLRRELVRPFLVYLGELIVLEVALLQIPVVFQQLLDFREQRIEVLGDVKDSGRVEGLDGDIRLSDELNDGAEFFEKDTSGVTSSPYFSVWSRQEELLRPAQVHELRPRRWWPVRSLLFGSLHFHPVLDLVFD